MNQTPGSTTLTAGAPRPGVIKRLYLWVLHWAETPYGTPALFGLSFAESSFFPIPPDVLQIALSLSKPRRSFWYALVSGVGSVLGALLGWAIGFGVGMAARGFFETYVPGCSKENFELVQTMYAGNAFMAILGAAFTPIPYKVFTVSAGLFEISLWTLILASILGRFGRFFLVGTAIFFFGPSVKVFLDEYLGWITTLLFVLLIGGFFAIKWLF